MRATDAILVHFDHAWSHDWESLQAVLRDTTEEEGQWQAPSYRHEDDEEGWPPQGSIAWQVAHLAYYKRFYTRMLGAIGADERPDAAPRVCCTTLEEELRELESAHGEQRRAVAALTDEQLEAPLPNGTNVMEFLAMCVRHDTWHAGQIAVARRLWRQRG